MKGAAIATLTARIVELIFIMSYVYKSKDHPLAANLSTIFHLDKQLCKRVIKTALPVAASESAWSIGTTGLFVAYGLLGTSAVAVVQVAGVINDLFQCIFFGLGNACAVMIGNELGRNNKRSCLCLWQSIYMDKSSLLHRNVTYSLYKQNRYF